MGSIWGRPHRSFRPRGGSRKDSRFPSPARLSWVLEQANGRRCGVEVWCSPAFSGSWSVPPCSVGLLKDLGIDCSPQGLPSDFPLVAFQRRDRRGVGGTGPGLRCRKTTPKGRARGALGGSDALLRHDRFGSALLGYTPLFSPMEVVACVSDLPALR